MSAARGLRLVGVLVAAALSAIACCPTASGATRPTVASVPLNSSIEQPTATWLVVPMGNLSSPLNTFWQLLVRPTTGPDWVTVTPPGVADNGGLALDAEGGRVLAGFLPSQDLTFSPLALSTDTGQKWVGDYFPEALSAVPDALATGTDGVAIALGRAEGGTVLTMPTGASSWRALTTVGTLDHTRAGADCGIERLTAVAVAPDGDELVGAACARAGASAAFALTDGSVRPVVAPAPRTQVSVLRLLSTTSGVTGLFAARRGDTSELLAGWIVAGARSFSLSAPLALTPDGRLIATGSTASGGVFVLVGEGPHGERELAEANPASQPSWDVLPRPPRGTLGAAFSRGRIDAVTVHDSTLIDYTLDQANETWVLAQRLRVPIEYGSSN